VTPGELRESSPSRASRSICFRPPPQIPYCPHPHRLVLLKANFVISFPHVVNSGLFRGVSVQWKRLCSISAARPEACLPKPLVRRDFPSASSDFFRAGLGLHS